MKILVTGATGFVGQHVVAEALRRNHSVIALSRDLDKAKAFDWFKDVTFVQFDLNTDTASFDLVQKPDFLIHLAWSGLPNYKSLYHLEENLPASMRFIRSLVSGGLKKLMVTGTCFEFGMQNGSLSPITPTYPENPYAIAKDTLRKWVESLHSEFQFQHQWVRLFYMFGEGQNPKSILSQLERAIENSEPVFNMSGGEQLRDYLPVEDIAKELLDFAENPDDNVIKHCCSENPISIRSLVENHMKKLNKTIPLNLGYYPYPDYEPMAFWGKK